MKTKTDLQIEYTFLSWKYDFPPDVEVALEDDYLANSHLYDEGTLKRVATLLLIDPRASAEGVLTAVRNCWSEVAH